MTHLNPPKPEMRPSDEAMKNAALTLWRLAASKGAVHGDDWKFSANDLARELGLMPKETAR